MTNYRNIVIDGDLVTAINSVLNSRVQITKSVSDIYRCVETQRLITYLPVTYRDGGILADIEDLFRGRDVSAAHLRLKDVYIRYGWLDGELESLEWSPVLSFYRRWCEKRFVEQDNTKMGSICKMLSISKKDLHAPLRSPQLVKRARAALIPKLKR